MNRHVRRPLARQRQPRPAAEVLTEAELLEKDEQARVVQLYRAVGCVVYSLSQPRATMQTEGLPDLYVVCKRKRTAWWHEVKRRNGPRLAKQRAEQVEFEALMEHCDVAYVLGGFDEAYAHLEAIGVIAHREEQLIAVLPGGRSHLEAIGVIAHREEQR